MPDLRATLEGTVATVIAESLRRGELAQATALARELLTKTVGLAVSEVSFTNDEYSLNSVSGRVVFVDSTVRFFKFHTEEGEQGNVAEYYRARLLVDVGLPVDVPIAMSSQPGSQLAVYALRTEPRMADVCLDIERADGARAALPPALLDARRNLDRRIADVMLSSLQPTTTPRASALHQLFGYRLFDEEGQFPGSRFKRWYVDDPAWAGLSRRRWRINGVEYASTLAEVAESAADLLRPSAFATEPVVVAHGDDHHGNVWVAAEAGETNLVMFDLAFAGDDLPVLLAPIKATFHNALAHPFWLYHPTEVAELTPLVVDGDFIDIAVDLELSPLRQAVLDSAHDLIWTPILRQLSESGQLNNRWRSIIRAALFACPMLVTNLLAGHRPPAARWTGLARALMCGSEPLGGNDPVSRMLDDLAAGIAKP